MKHMENNFQGGTKVSVGGTQNFGIGRQAFNGGDLSIDGVGGEGLGSPQYQNSLHRVLGGDGVLKV